MPKIRNSSDLINQLMHPNPEHRQLPGDAINHPWFKDNPANPEQARKTLAELIK